MSTIQPFFKIERKRAIKEHRRIVDLDMNFPEVAAKLKYRSSMEELGKSDRKVAMFQGGAGLALSAYSISINHYFAGVVALTVPYAGWRFIKAEKRLRAMEDAWSSAKEKMVSLEGEAGFLWRFEHLLEDWGLDLEKDLRKTLGPICASSKRGSVSDGDELYLYWLWISFVKGRLSVLIEQTDAIDKEGVVKDLVVMVSQEYRSKMGDW